MRVGATILAVLCLAPSTWGGAPAAERLEVYPPQVRLDSARDRQSLVSRITTADGITRDVTAQATASVDNPAVARVEAGVVVPVADGAATLTIQHAEHALRVPVSVSGAATERPVSFRLDIMPVFMRNGCNAGSCHGSARGQDGFRLSLFGYDPDGDHQRLTRELPGRRINLARPEQSLLLAKATSQAPHSGGKLFDQQSESYQTILRWLQAGAPKDPTDLARPVGLELSPDRIVLEPDGTQRLMARAIYSDGSDRDVTHLALLQTSNDNSAVVEEPATVRARNPGESFVMARFATFTVGVEVITVPRGSFTWAAPPQHNLIDVHVDEKLQRLRVIPSGLADDAAFLRRAYLDLVGELPTREQFEAFCADGDPQKRARLIDELLARPQFVDLWTMRLAELLAIRSGDAERLSEKSALLYHRWLRQQIESGTPLNQIARALLTAGGQTFEQPAANYYIAETDTLKLMENTAQALTGMRLQCAQCHNHPFDRWTMDDYYGFASFFSQVGRKPAEDRRAWIVFPSGGGEVNHPVTGKPVPPTLPGGAQPAIPPGQDRRQALAEWIAAPDNPYLARHMANVVWAHFFGRGIVEPVDDVRISNPPSNAALLDALAQQLSGSGFDLRQLVRLICNSRTYQLAGTANASNQSDVTGFARAPVRRIRAEVLLDVISQVSESPDDLPGLPRGGRAVQIADGRTSTYFLTTFGRATRQTVCTCEVKMEPNLSQALHLLNGETVNNKVRGGLIGRLLDQRKLSPAQVVEELYIRCLTRRSTPEELGRLLPLLDAEGADKQQVLTDIFWALLNSREFVFNH